MIQHRPHKPHIAARAIEQQVAHIVDCRALLACNPETYAVGVGSRRNHQIVLEVPLSFSVVDEVDARIKIAVANTLVGKNSGLPLRRIAAMQEIDLGLRGLQPLDARVGVGAVKL